MNGHGIGGIVQLCFQNADGNAVPAANIFLNRRFLIGKDHTACHSAGGNNSGSNTGNDLGGQTAACSGSGGCGGSSGTGCRSTGGGSSTRSRSACNSSTGNSTGDILPYLFQSGSGICQHLRHILPEQEVQQQRQRCQRVQLDIVLFLVFIDLCDHGFSAIIEPAFDGSLGFSLDLGDLRDG